MQNQLDAACRVAFAGLVHDLGKFAQRAELGVPKERKETHQQLYCRQREIDGKIFWTHEHAACTALFFDVLEKGAPDLVRGDAYPFASRSAGGDITDSIINAAAAHHKPETFLQWIIATADRVASGFEREEYDDIVKPERSDHITKRLRSLLEEVSFEDGKTESTDLHTAFPLKPLSAASLFPKKIDEVESADKEKASDEYRSLWYAFSEAIDTHAKEPIPDAFRKNWGLWLDVFDTAWMTYTALIPSAAAFGVRPDVSLYDHSKATAALATALWKWHESEKKTDAEAIKALKERTDWNENKFLLIQGDFFGIQNFIFAEGSQTNKKSAKILRGRSFYVSLLSELAGLRVLQALSLAPTSQIFNTAGKFLIVAPNTGEVIQKLREVRRELDAWFVKNTFALAGIGLVWTEASCQDFIEKKYDDLAMRLAETLDRDKYQRYDLPNWKNPVLEADFSHGVCAWQSRLPADGTSEESGNATCALTRDEICVGECLTKYKRILILEGNAEIHPSGTVQVLDLPIFGMKVAFVQDSEESGNFSRLAAAGKLLRCWDFSLPEKEDEVLWHGFARRNINGYVPRYTEKDFSYGGTDYAEGKDVGCVKLFEDIAAADSHKGKGIKALMTVKGDVDDLGMIFQKGLTSGGRSMTFAKTAGLSRQLNAFFAVWLPWRCSQNFSNVYTVFAGGDDFFLIGPWKESQRLIAQLRSDFDRYTGMNEQVHFSVGTVVTKSSVPIKTLSSSAEEALALSKSSGKNRLTLYGKTVEWKNLKQLKEIEDFLSNASQEFGVSTGYLYGLFRILALIGEEERGNPQAALWRSQLYYSTARLFERQRKERSRDMLPAREQFLNQLIRYLDTGRENFRIPLTNVFYSVRESKEGKDEGAY